MPPPPPDGSGTGGGRRAFYDVLSAAIADLTEHGFDSQQRLDGWLERIRRAAIQAMAPQHEVEAAVRDALTAVYQRQIERGGILRYHPGVAQFTLNNVRPRLHDELRRRVMASSGLIKLNRQKAVDTTLQRFAGWATSIPPGGSDVVAKRETGQQLRKALVQLPFEERRVAIDQAHKFTANLSEIIAVDGGAIAGVWRSNWLQTNYDYRRDHKERDQRVYAVRGSWAVERGLINKGEAYTDEITQPGEEVFCRCFYRWVYSLRDLPADMLTAKGRAELERVRAAR